MQVLTYELPHRVSALRLESYCHQMHHRTESLLQRSDSSALAMLHLLQKSLHRLENNKAAEVGTAPTTSFISSQSISKPSKPSASQPYGDDMAIQDYSNNQLRFDTTFTRSCCSFCTCSCHKQIRLKSPNFLKNILGLVFVGYTSVPLVSTPQTCDLASCRRQGESATTITYVFPLWFVQRTMIVKFQGKGPEFENNNLEVVKKLLVAGEASILDVNEDGQSLLHVSYDLSPIRCFDC